MGKLFILFLCSLFLQAFAMTPQEALNRLMTGNERFAKAKLLHKHQDMATRESTRESQHPFAVIVTCSDSRVSPEILFDQGIGDLFVVRVAGNVIGPYELESINYAVEHLGSSIVLVMGHQNCGAVDAAMQGMTEGIPFIAQILRASVIKAREFKTNDLLRLTIELNAKAMAEFLLDGTPVQKMKQAGKVDVKSAYYDFQKGKVILL